MIFEQSTNPPQEKNHILPGKASTKIYEQSQEHILLLTVRRGDKDTVV